MKSLVKVFVLFFLIVGLSSCGKTGDTYQIINGHEENIPAELKGIKVYSITTGNGWSNVKVAILNNEINSLTYPVGKTEETTIVINPKQKNQRIITAKEIISETDSILVVRIK